MEQKDIWEINLSPANENKKIKKGLCVILSSNEMGNLPLNITAPIIKYKEEYEDILWMVKIMPDNINKINDVSVIDIFQLKSIPQRRFIKKIGKISDNDFKKCVEAINLVLGIY